MDEEELSPAELIGKETEDRFEEFLKTLKESGDISGYRRTTTGHPLDRKGIDFLIYSLTGKPWRFQVKSGDYLVRIQIKKQRDYCKETGGRCRLVTVVNGNWTREKLTAIILRRLYG